MIGLWMFLICGLVAAVVVILFALPVVTPEFLE